MDQNFENKIDKVKVIQEINEFLKGFKNSYDIKTTLEDLNKVIIENQYNLDPSFNLKVVLENNPEFKIIVEKKNNRKQIDHGQRFHFQRFAYQRNL